MAKLFVIFLLWCVGSYLIYHNFAPGWTVAYGLGTLLLAGGYVYYLNRTPKA